MEDPAGHAEDKRQGGRDDDDEGAKRGRNKRERSRFVDALEDGVNNTGAGPARLRGALAEALLSSKQVAIEYRAADDGDDADAPEKKRGGIEGNEGARSVLDELERLVRLARTAYPGPDDLRDLGPLRWGRHWARTRYRFMDLCLRDDPVGWAQFFDKRGPGDAANQLVRDGAVEEDCFVVESKWFDAAKRQLYCEIYHLTPENGRRLRDSAMSADVRASYRGLFEWAIKLVNLCVNRRAAVLRAAARAIVGGGGGGPPGPTAATGVNARKAFRIQHHKAAEKDLAAAGGHYSSLTGALMVLVEEATVGGKQLRTPSYNAFRRAVDDISRSVRDLNNPLNASPHLRRSWQGSLRRWPASAPTKTGFANTPTTPNP
ncbi:hypothetical protein DL769_006026 [Monosporascus sp. CRB-8-3]|nr:hypothetical protein DL769_006026 [Monosporascus sp. CRB-8-3]